MVGHAFYLFVLIGFAHVGDLVSWRRLLGFATWSNLRVKMVGKSLDAFGLQHATDDFIDFE